MMHLLLMDLLSPLTSLNSLVTNLKKPLKILLSKVVSQNSEEERSVNLVMISRLVSMTSMMMVQSRRKNQLKPMADLLLMVTESSFILEHHQEELLPKSTKR